MKLAPEALAQIIEILRLGLSEGRDVSQLLRELDLVPNSLGQLVPAQPSSLLGSRDSG